MSTLLRHRLRVAAVFCALGLVAGACAGETSTVAVGSNDGAATSPTTGTTGTTSAPANTASPATPAGPAATDAATPDPAIDYPSFSAITSTGEAFELSDHAGEDVLLWFWAPW